MAQASTRPFRILQLNSARKYIGEAAHTLNLTEALRQRGHHVWLGLRKNYDTINRASDRGLDPIGFHMPHRWWPPQDGPDIRHIASLVRDNRIDLIHAHRGKDHWQAVFATRLFRLRVPVIRTRHVVTPLSTNAANKWLARRTAALVIVSNAVKADVARTEMYPGTRLVFIPGGIDLKLFKPATVQEKTRARLKLVENGSALPDSKTPIAICVARFAKVKAHSVLLAAWRRVHEQIPGASLLLIGDGLLMADSQALADKLGIRESVFFLGRRYDVPELLNAADVGVLSSIGSEGFSRAVLEYMSKALPTVATRVGAVPDLIEDGINGFLVNPYDEAMLAEKLIHVLNADETKRNGWGNAAHEKAANGYGYESWAAAHEQLYARVLSVP